MLDIVGYAKILMKLKFTIFLDIAFRFIDNIILVYVNVYK